MLVFFFYSEKNLTEQRREPPNPTHRLSAGPNLGYNGGR